MTAADWQRRSRYPIEGFCFQRAYEVNKFRWTFASVCLCAVSNISASDIGEE